MTTTFHSIARVLPIVAVATFCLAAIPACSSEVSDDASVEAPGSEGNTGQVSQAICYPVPQPYVSEVIPKFDCAPAAGAIQATAPSGYTKQACTSYFMVEGIEDTHTPGCPWGVYFASFMAKTDIPTSSLYCSQSYVDHVVVGYKDGVATTLHNARTYGVWNSGYCTGLGQVGWVLHDAQNLGYDKYRFYTRAYRANLFGLAEAGVSVKIQEGL